MVWPEVEEETGQRSVVPPNATVPPVDEISPLIK